LNKEADIIELRSRHHWIKKQTSLNKEEDRTLSHSPLSFIVMGTGFFLFT